MKNVLLPLTLLLGMSVCVSAETIRCAPGAGSAFRSAVERVRAAGGGTIDFEKGDYDFDPAEAAEMKFFISNHDQSAVHRVQLPLVGVTNVTVRGNGARFFFTGDVIALTLLDTKDVRLEGFSVDWRTPFITEARATGFANGRTQLDREPVWRPVGNCMLFRGDTHEVVERTGSVPLRRDHSKVGLRVGDVVALRPSGRPAPAAVVYRATDTVVGDVVVHTCHGMAWIVQRSENFTLRGRGRAADRTCGVFPSAGRITSAHADATHFSNVKGRVVVENCCFEGMMDDAINVHATCLGVQEVVAPDRIRCRYMHFQAIGFETSRPGETLRLIRGKTLENGPEIPVKAVERLDDREIVVTLARPIPSGYGAGDAVENADYHPEVVFRHNYIARNRARGALFTTPKRVLCEGNLFDHVSGSAILFAGDAQGWYESGATTDALVTNNVFRNCTTSRHSFGFTEAVVSLYPEVKDLAAQRTRYHRNVRIVGNRFETFDVPLLFAISCSNLVFRGNEIVRNADYAGWGEGDFIVRDSEDVVTEVVVGRSMPRSGVE